MPVSFGDSPCIFEPFRMIEGGFGFYHREPLVLKAVLQPLVACASHPHCLVPVSQMKVQKCLSNDTPRTTVGWCHRADQSAMSIVLARLFREHYYYFAINMMHFMRVRRGTRSNGDYFKHLSDLKEQKERLKHLSETIRNNQNDTSSVGAKERT